MFQPRDIVLVLDFSASMNDDSAFNAIGKLPQATVEASLQNCWNDLGPPVYGDMGFTPSWVVAEGVSQNDAAQLPHITVEYRQTSRPPALPLMSDKSDGVAGTPNNSRIVAARSDVCVKAATRRIASRPIGSRTINGK